MKKKHSEMKSCSHRSSVVKENDEKEKPANAPFPYNPWGLIRANSFLL